MSKTSYEIVVKAVAWFTILDQVRQQATDEADKLLTENILQHGVLQPVGARRLDGKLVWGHRRLRCAIAAGLQEIPTVLLPEDMSESDYLTLQLLENVARVDLSPHDLWQGCVRLLEAEKGLQLKDLAKKLSLDPASITRALSPSRCTAQWQAALKDGKVSLDDCYTASRRPESEQDGLLELRLSGATRDQLVAAAKGSPAQPDLTPASKPSRVSIPLPKIKATVVVTSESASLDGLIAVLTDALEVVRKSIRDNITLATAKRTWADKAKAKGA